MGGYQPARGDIWLVDLGIAQKTRPVVILSVNPIGDERVVFSYMARTTSIRHTRFEVPHEGRGFKPGVFDAQSMGTAPGSWFLKKIGEVSNPLMKEIEDAVRQWLKL